MACNATLNTAADENLFKGASSLAVDPQGVVYQAIYAAGSTTVLARVNAALGAIQFSYTGITAEGFGVLCDPNQVDQGTKTESVYLLTTPVATTNYAVHKLSLLDITTTDGSPRQLVNLAVSNGTIKTFVAGAGAPATPSGGASALSTSVRWVQAAAAFNRVLFTDGLVYKSYDALSGVVSAWAATDGGTIPPRGRLLDIWNGRAIVTGIENDPQNWAMSEAGNFDGWDFFPAVVTTTQAVVGNNTKAGLCPDIINAFIPYNDDLAVFGCDHSLWRLTGDPAAGGQIDLVSDITGMAWGRSWCKDSGGNLYFFGSQGGLFIVAGGGAPAEMTAVSLSKRFADVDVGLNKIQLAWNDREKCVHVFITPYSAGATKHYVWDAINQAWWPDQFTTTNHDPLSVYVVDGDAPGDRVMLLGGRDGYVRKWDIAAKDDDGVATSSYVVMGPVQASGLGREFKLHDWRAVLASTSDNVTLTAYGQESADYTILGAADLTATLTAGRNSGILDRVRGQAIYVKLAFATIAKRWAFESLIANPMPAGRARNR